MNEKAQSVFKRGNYYHQNHNFNTEFEDVKTFDGEERRIQTIDVNHPLKALNCSSLELMKLAIDLFTTVCVNDGNFGRAKSKLMYVYIGVNMHLKDLKLNQQSSLLTILD